MISSIHVKSSVSISNSAESARIRYAEAGSDCWNDQIGETFYLNSACQTFHCFVIIWSFPTGTPFAEHLSTLVKESSLFGGGFFCKCRSCILPRLWILDRLACRNLTMCLDICRTFFSEKRVGLLIYGNLEGALKKNTGVPTRKCQIK